MNDGINDNGKKTKIDQVTDKEEEYDLSLNVNDNLINVDKKGNDKSKKLNFNDDNDKKDHEDNNMNNNIDDINDRLKVLNKTVDDLQKLVYDSEDNY